MFWEEIIAYFPLIRHGPHRKQKIGGYTDSKVISSDFFYFFKHGKQNKKCNCYLLFYTDVKHAVSL
jgi:hypothetical protein